jgi:hypothetical protein
MCGNVLSDNSRKEGLYFPPLPQVVQQTVYAIQTRKVRVILMLVIRKGTGNSD